MIGIKKFFKALTVKDIRKRIFFTLGILAVYRLLAAVTTPGVPKDALNQLFGDGTFGDLLTAVSGAAFQNAAVVAIGLGPYINASIILQLLGTVIPALEELQKEGERGKALMSQYTRLLTVPFSILQSFVIYTILRSQGLISTLEPVELLTMVAAMTAGSMFIMWLGELIQEYGVGNGISVMIFAGILASLPGSIIANIGVANPNLLLIVGIGAILLVGGIVWVTTGERRIDIQYAKRVRGSKVTAGGASHIPLRINTAGVMPVIFAISLISFPEIIARFFITSQNETVRNVAEQVVTFLDPNANTYYIFYFLLIMMFTFFYTFVVFKPHDVADNLKKSGGFIPGIRPGKQTEEYIFGVLLRLTIVGAIFLAVVAIIPTLVQRYTGLSSIAIGGTGLLIIISVVIDMMRQVEAMSVTRSYDVYK